MKTIIAYLHGDEMKTAVSYLRGDEMKTIMAYLICFTSVAAVLVTLMFVIAYIDTFNYFV